MIAVNIPKRTITFKTGMTTLEKYIAVRQLWWNSKILICYFFPKFLKNYDGSLLPIPDVISFEQDPNM